jgi:hypothetical protein
MSIKKIFLLPVLCIQPSIYSTSSEAAEVLNGHYPVDDNISIKILP